MSVIVEETVEVALPEMDPGDACRREILLDAARLIEERGYTSGCRGMSLDGPFCMLGAIAAAMGAPQDEIIYSDDGESLMPGYSYDLPEAMIGWVSKPNRMASWRWSDSQRDYSDPAGRVARALRRMANGLSWKEAIKS